MAIFKKNIWLLFYILFTTSLILLFTIAYTQWKYIYAKHQTAQENIVNLIATSTHSLFQNQEMMLDILGRRFMEDDDFRNNPESLKALDSLLTLNPSIAAFGLSTPQGQLTFMSSHPDVSNLPNLLSQIESKDSFLETLSSQHMVLGRTYMFHSLKEWVIPLRKAIRNHEGEVIAVMVGGLRVESSFNLLSKTIHNSQDRVISMIRDHDFYTLFRSNNNKTAHLFYLEPIPAQTISNIEHIVLAAYHMTLDQLRDSEQIISFTCSNTTGKKITSIQYDKHYKLWTTAQTDFTILVQEFISIFLQLIAIFVVTQLILFFLFRLIANADIKRTADLMFQATHDKLTGLPNRSYLQQHIDEWLYKDAPAFAILYVDMDHFKNINDNFGHQCGDYVLVELAKRLKNSIPQDAVVIRQGGDEFVIFVYEYRDVELLKLSHTIITKISQPYTINKLTLSMGASIGIAKYPEHAEDLDTLLRAADIAMYESKKMKNSAHIFANTMQEGYLKNLHIEQALRNAIDSQELFMVYQPQIDSTNAMIGVEALIRWKSPTLGMVPPDKFIPIAEASGLMLKLGRFIINTVLEDIKYVQNSTSFTFQTSINISVRQFMDPDF
ncbi:MAG: diguanylate cyclase [Sulfurospirillaceae bacterium]|nr:diguanylate cyclase [Sulfurospirillaceae bacterium]MDD2826440.1 diguanylate cyclase [Sulfurospirillaceae bacterium]